METEIAVLHVDDAPDFLAVTADLLELEDSQLTVLSAETPGEGLKILQERRIDCVVAEYEMAEMNGFEFLELIRCTHANLPFILFTGKGSEEIASEAISLGVTDYLQKGTRKEQYTLLANRIRNAVQAYRGNAESAEPVPDSGSEIHTELQLATEGNVLSQLLEQVPASVYVKDSEARHLLASEYDGRDIDAIGKTDLELYGDELAEKSYADDMQVIETGEPLLNREEYDPDTEEWMLTSKVPWYGDSGQIKGLIGVTRFITEKKEYEAEIERKNEYLEQLSALVGHDLRNPLNVALARLSILQEKYDDEDHLDEALNALHRMEALTDKLLQMARQGKTISETEPVQLETVFESAWRIVETPEATYDIVASKTIDADESRLVDVFSNLIRNSIEHNSESPHIEVGATADGFYYQDDGTGVPAEMHADVFEAGYSDQPDGTGFGLAIVSGVVEAHGWEIALSESPEGGVRFEITVSESTNTT